MCTPAELEHIACGTCGCDDPACGLMLLPRRVLQICCAQCDEVVTQIALSGVRAADGTIADRGLLS